MGVRAIIKIILRAETWQVRVHGFKKGQTWSNKLCVITVTARGGRQNLTTTGSTWETSPSVPSTPLVM